MLAGAINPETIELGGQMWALRCMVLVLTTGGALLAPRAGTIEISDSLDTFTQEMAEKGRWVFWGAAANVFAAAGNIALLLFEYRKRR